LAAQYSAHVEAYRFRVWKGGKHVTSLPRFLLLVGTPRSGTSWLGKLFDSHPQTLYKHEPDRSIDLPFALSLEEAERVAGKIQDFFARLSAINTPHVAGRMPVFSKQYRSAWAQCVHRGSVLATTAAGSIGRKLPVLQAADVYSPEIRVVWKSTDSLGRLGVILRVIEDCRAVRILRHPCGYISSVLRGEAQQKFVASVPTSEDYGLMQILLEAAGRFRRGLSVERLRQFHPVERMAWMWVLLNEKAMADTAGHERCASVRYEDVCFQPEEKVKELFSFFGLGWSAQTLDFIRASTLVSQRRGLERITQNEQRYYSVFRNPALAAEKWKSELRPEDIERVYRVLRQSDLIRAYPEPELQCALPVRMSANS
jgi:hypothetical protein